MNTSEAFLAALGFTLVHTPGEAKDTCTKLSFPRQVGFQVSDSGLIIGLMLSTGEAALKKIRESQKKHPNWAIGVSGRRNGKSARFH